MGTTEWSADLVKRLGAESEARVSADLQLRSEFTNAMVVVKSQFEEWMEMVTALKSEVASLAQAAKQEKDARAREAVDKRSEIAAVMEVACSTFAQDLDESRGKIMELNSPADVSHFLSSNGNSDLGMVCRLINDTLGHASRLWKKCASESAKCHEETRAVADKADTFNFNYGKLAESGAKKFPTYTTSLGLIQLETCKAKGLILHLSEENLEW